MKNSFADILKSIDDRSRKKLAAKVPEWADAGIELPSSLNLEQCSSSVAAAYKANLAAGLGAGRIADLTGGLGVDCWAFSKVSEEVLYNDRDNVLAGAVGRNFAALGVSNVSIISHDALSEATQKALKEFAPDLIFIDPARRNGRGGKVFLLEECSPNIVGMIPSLLDISRHLMLKLSPMADISMLASRLGSPLKEIHVVGVGGECKELLCILEKGFRNQYRTIVSDLHDRLSFFRSEEEEAAAVYEDDPDNARLLFEPSPTLMKSGAFKLICSRLGVRKLGRDTHIYTCDSEVNPLGKTFRILEVLPLSGASIKAAAARYPRAEVTARGLHLSSEELRSRLRVRSGGDIHIFAATCTDRARIFITSAVKTIQDPGEDGGNNEDS